jgi:bifunctional non-homologous end joining protein LigD
MKAATRKSGRKQPAKKDQRSNTRRSAKALSNALDTYKSKRDFAKTPEPPPDKASKPNGNSFMVQHHWATRDHFDFRLELDGVLKSWAVTRGPSANPKTKRLAVRTEDHPLSYATFEGTIPKSEYGGGTVMLWDRGTWASIDKNPQKALDKGSLKFVLNGERMKGEWTLVRLKDEGKRENWLLIKHRDEFAEDDDTLAERFAKSVASGRGRREIEKGEVPKSFAKAKTSTVKPRFPEFVPPQLCDTLKAPPGGDDWLFEMKYDGYRLQVQVSGGEARALTRNGLDWSAKFPAIIDAAKRLDVKSATIDGEAVIFDAKGISDFPALVASLEHGRSQAVLQVFDLLEHDGESLRRHRLLERKQALKALLRRSGTALRFSEHVIGGGEKIFAQAIAAGAEGITAKKCSSIYTSGRSTTWAKIKGDVRRDAYIVGWTSSDRGRPFASLLGAVETDGILQYSGGIGTGFSQAKQKEILQKISAHEIDGPIEGLVNAELAPRKAHWCKPLYEAEIALTGFTEAGQMRHPRFIELKEATRAPRKAGAKKAAKSAAVKVSRTQQAPEESKKPKTAASKKAKTSVPVGSVASRITHPERIVYPDVGFTKGEIAAYYEAMAPLIIPHIKDRPLSVIRAPDGIEGEQFFQRHPMKGMGKGIIPVRSGAKTYFALDGAEGLLSAAQFSVIELHGWGTRTDIPANPDRLVMDLDPDPAVPFKDVVALARQMREVLEAAGLKTYPLISGGKGVHVVVPLDASANWDLVSTFAELLAKKMAAGDPAHLIAVSTLARRKGKIFIDYLRNKQKATAIMPYSLRAKPGAPIAMPLDWSQLGRVKEANQFTMKDGLRKKPVWSDYFTSAGRITKAMVEALK